jgi:IS30 family transposase
MGFEIRADRGENRGRGGLPRERAEYFRLMDQGHSNAAACRAVGVTGRTGRRWRHGRPPEAPRRPRPRGAGGRPSPPPPDSGSGSGSGRYLSEDERIRIADRLLEGASVRAIAAGLGRSASTVSREIKRNAQPDGRYRPHAAHARAAARRPRPKARRLDACAELRGVVWRHLGKKRSPAQIAAMLRGRFPGRPEMHVCHETIYQALYVQGRGELRREIAAALRSGRARRRPRRRPERRRPRFAEPMLMISDRPAEAADRAVPGHWEGDLIIGKDSASQIGTLVERATRYVLLVHLPASRDAETVRDALAAAMAGLPAQLRKSLTWDQGREMALARQFSAAAGMPVYFCDPHSPWQRGSNENTNGLLRQYFPKGTDLSRHPAARLDQVAAELNTRPRKTLDWETPAERLAKLLTPAD